MIEINGRRYDAVTGRLADGVQKATAGVGSIDGVFRAKTDVVKNHSKRSIRHLKKHTQRSQTLMRSVVKKPIISKSRDKKTPLGHKPSRDLRANMVSMHPSVRHHGKQVNGDIVSHEGEVLPRNTGRSTALAISAATPQLAAGASHQHLERLLDYALARADAHKRKQQREHNGPAKLLHILPKWLTITLIIIIVGTISGFVAWQKVPALSLRVAASKAHVDASVPDLPGYAISAPATVKNGAISVQYKAVTDSTKTVTVTKKVSDTKDASAVAKETCPNDNQIQTFQQSGSIGFICGQTKEAVDIENGVITQIKSDSGQPISDSIGNILTNAGQ